MERVGMHMGLLLALLCSAVPALAGGVKAGALTHQRCGAGLCKIDVVHGLPPVAGNSCGIQVPDIVFLGRLASRVEWSLKPAAGAPALRFVVGKRVAVDDNNGRSNEAGVPDIAGRVFDDEADAPTVDAKTINSSFRDKLKAFTYTIYLERPKAGGGFEPCDAYDPLIVNRD